MNSLRNAVCIPQPSLEEIWSSEVGIWQKWAETDFTMIEKCLHFQKIYIPFSIGRAEDLHLLLRVYKFLTHFKTKQNRKLPAWWKARCESLCTIVLMWLPFPTLSLPKVDSADKHIPVEKKKSWEKSQLTYNIQHPVCKKCVGILPVAKMFCDFGSACKWILFLLLLCAKGIQCQLLQMIWDNIRYAHIWASIPWPYH